MAKTLRVPNLPHCAHRSFAFAMLDGVGHAFGTVLVYGILVVAAFFAIRIHSIHRKMKALSNGLVIHVFPRFPYSCGDFVQLLWEHAKDCSCSWNQHGVSVSLEHALSVRKGIQTEPYKAHGLHGVSGGG